MADQVFDENMFTLPYQLTEKVQRDLYPSVDPKSSSLSAKGKVIIITGAGGGLGAAVARAWAQAGAAGVVLAGRTQKTLELTAENVAGISKDVPVIVKTTDVSDAASVAALFEEVKSRFGKAHVLFNAAGTFGGGLIGDIPLSSWWTDFETNVKGTFLTTQSFLQSFGSEGTIINLVSVAVTMANPGTSSYASSKLAVIKLSEFVGIEYPNARAFSVHPGIVDAADRGMVVDALTPFAKDTQALTGGMSLWLATPEADFLAGGFLTVNWDVDEMKAHATEITEGNLNKLGFLKGQLGPGGYPWGAK